MGFRYCFDPEFGFRGKKLNVQGQVVVKEFHPNQPKYGILTESKINTEMILWQVYI